MSLLTDAAALAARPGRALLGLAGPPGAGKSTLAHALVAGLPPGTAAYVPMDGFHLSQAQLARLGRADRKGAPDTFDIDGYVALLRRLRTETDRDVYVPDFDRTIEEPIAAGLVVPARTPLVVTEGNYLASDEPGWREIRSLLTELWYLEVPDEVREDRLVARRVAVGQDPSVALAWATGSDRANGELIKTTRGRCDRVVDPTAPVA